MNSEFLVLAGIVGTAINILYVALGLGLVIFFHELGHFAVAKWCNVHVERFSIGFGPILLSKKKGETEYALSLIPFGGYVKMLGQDDMDPSQLTSEEIKEDPRSYSAKSVPQRMAIISAGVIMNIITGMLFYATAFGFGVPETPPTVGHVQVGSRAWIAGIRPGDEITQINDRKIETFIEITFAIVLTSGDLEIWGKHRDGTEFGPVVITPDGSGTRRMIGVGPTRSASVARMVKGQEHLITTPGMAASRAKPPLEPGDVIIRVDKTKIENFATLQWTLAKKRRKQVKFYVDRDSKDGTSELTEIIIEANNFRTLGLLMDIGEIAAVRRESPAERAGLKAGDRITAVGDNAIGSKINPLQLPDLFEAFCEKREPVVLKVLRKLGGKEPEEVEVRFESSDRVIPGWLERPIGAGAPLSIASLGVAIHMRPTIVSVVPESPAAVAGIVAGERIESMEFAPHEDRPVSKKGDANPLLIEFPGKEKKTDRKLKNWAYAFWRMQTSPSPTVTLSVVNEKGESRTVELTPAKVDDWFLPTRGFVPGPAVIVLQTDGFVDSLQLGTKKAKNSLVNIYLTLRSLFSGGISPKELSGPVGIAKVAYMFAEQGIPKLLVFLGFLSVNLAVINFLPIPVLDGGHMVFLCWEGITRRKPSEKVMIAASYVGIAFVLGLMAFVLYLDIFVH